jgi:hydroxycarboxylate dehydrogenase B
MGPVTVSRESMGAWGERLLTALGAPSGAAQTTLKHLLEAEVAGHPSHGVRMLVAIAAAIRQGPLDPAAEPVVEFSSGGVARIDGRWALGPVVGLFSTGEAIRLAHEHGSGAVAVHSSGHMGRLAPFAAAAASAGCALFMAANDAGNNQHVAPPGGRVGRLGTNPIAIGVPRQAPPHLVVDMATSVIAHGAVAALTDAGDELPTGARAAGDTELLAPMAGYKGFALSLVVEALAGAVTGAGVVRADPGPDSQGALLMAVDVSRIGSADAAVRDLETAIDWVRSAAAPNGPPIRIPGEFTVPDPGVVTIAAPVWASLVELSGQLGVPCPVPESAGPPSTPTSRDARGGRS